MLKPKNNMADWFEGFSYCKGFGFLGISAIAVNSGLPLQINGGQGCLVLDIPKFAVLVHRHQRTRETANMVCVRFSFISFLFHFRTF